MRVRALLQRPDFLRFRPGLCYRHVTNRPGGLTIPLDRGYDETQENEKEWKDDFCFLLITEPVPEALKRACEVLSRRRKQEREHLPPYHGPPAPPGAYAVML